MEKSIIVILARIGFALNSSYKKSDTAQLNSTVINCKILEVVNIFYRHKQEKVVSIESTIIKNSI